MRTQVLDVTDEPAWADVAAQVRDREGRFDLLPSNAGMSLPAAVHELTRHDWDGQIAVNLTAAFLDFRAVFPVLRQDRAPMVLTSRSTPSEDFPATPPTPR